MTDCADCGSGNYSCPCCCASVTGLRAGIHPDYIESESIDLHLANPSVRTFQVGYITFEPVHIINVSAALVCVKRDTGTDLADMRKQIQSSDNAGQYREDAVTPVMFSLFTSKAWDAAITEAKGGWNPHDDDEEDRVYFTTGAVSSTAPSWQSNPDLFGYFCDRGIFIEMNTASEQYGIRVTVNYVERTRFSPAYGEPSQVLKHYWECAHIEDGEEFLGGFYGGAGSDGDGESDDEGGGDWSSFDPADDYTPGGPGSE